MSITLRLVPYLLIGQPKVVLIMRKDSPSGDGEPVNEVSLLGTTHSP